MGSRDLLWFRFEKSSCVEDLVRSGWYYWEVVVALGGRP